MESDLEIIYTASNLQQASILKGVLASEGIDATVTNIALQNLGGLATGWNSSPCVLVRREDVAVARALAVDFDESITHRSDSPMPPDAAYPDSADDDSDHDEEEEDGPPERTWPPCPRCDSPRRGRCSHCGAFDDGFTPAEYLLTDHQRHGEGTSATESFEVTSDDGRFMCSLCDEPVTPEPLRYCDTCGHDYGDGLVLEDGPVREPNNRATLTLVFLGLLGAALAAYYLIALR